MRLFLVAVLCTQLVSGERKSSTGGRRHAVHLSASTAASSYGQVLPAFSYDFSEYVTSAIIERSADGNDLHLSMFLVGHSVVFNDYPFETISTDESVLYNWGQASKKWDVNKNRTATTKHSGLMCILKNNDPKHSQPYRVPALWVPTGAAQDHKLHGSLEILRCRIKGATTIYSTLSKSLDSALFVDLVRGSRAGGGGSKGEAGGASHKSSTSSSSHRVSGHKQKNHGRRKLFAVGATVNTSSSSTSSVGDHDVLISFSVPWRSRQVGYGLSFPLNASVFDPWQESSKARALFGVKNRTLGIEKSQSLSTLAPKIHLCVAGLRPLHPVRSNVGLPELLEFVEHYVSLSADHIFFGLMLSPRSPHWTKYRHVLQSYVDRGQVSLSSMALDNFDDASGFGGVHLQDAYASMIFNNQCLYFSKGIADYIILLRATEFILPRPFLQIFLSSVNQKADAATAAVAASSGEEYRGVVPHLSSITSKIHGNATISLGQSLMRRMEAGENSCFFKITGTFGIPDPPELFGFMGGPGESSFVGDFFKDFKLVGPLSAPHWHASMLPTRLVVATTSRDAAVCSRRGGGGGGGGARSGAIVRAEAIPIDESVAVLFVHGALLKKSDYAASTSRKNDLLSAAARRLFLALRTRLSAKKLAKVEAVAALAQQGVHLHKQQAEEAMSSQVYLTEEERNALPLKQVPLAASALVAPFWLKCDVASLSAVLNKAFAR